MIRYRPDTLRGRVVAFECKDADDYDDAHAKQYKNTHFDTHADALAALVTSLSYQVKNEAVRYDQACRERRAARRRLARVAALLERVGGRKS